MFLPEKILIARAVKIDDSKKYPIYNDICRISYIPLHLSKLASLGRFNKNNQSMYYGCIFENDDSLNVPFHEINVEIEDYVNLLISELKEDVKVIFIGMFSYFKEDKLPFFLHPFLKEVYNYYTKTHDKKILNAIETVDDFFKKVTTLDGNDRVYNVTSILGNIYLNGDGDADGFIYPSVKVNETPNIVLKPNTIDKKVNHIEVKISLAKNNEETKMMDNQELNNGKVVNCKISWNY